MECPYSEHDDFPKIGLNAGVDAFGETWIAEIRVSPSTRSVKFHHLASGGESQKFDAPNSIAGDQQLSTLWEKLLNTGQVPT